jgi:hypothetical protein
MTSKPELDMIAHLRIGHIRRPDACEAMRVAGGHGFVSNIALQINDRAVSRRERGRSRFPHREPIGLHPRAPVDRILLEREGSGPAASLCLKATDYVRNPRTSRAAPRVAVFAEHPSSPQLGAEQTLGDSEVESMRCYRETAFDRCPAQSVRRCNRRPRRLAPRPSSAPRRARLNVR